VEHGGALPAGGERADAAASCDPPIAQPFGSSTERVHRRDFFRDQLFGENRTYLSVIASYSALRLLPGAMNTAIVTGIVFASISVSKTCGVLKFWM